MDLETLFTDVKWNILKSLSEKEQSPLELAEKLNMTISNVSQQLKLLEFAGLVKKKKIPNRDKGKPRTIFSLANDCSYLISVMSTLTEKKLLTLTEYHKIILKIWFIENPALHYYIEKFYWKIEDNLDDIKAIAVKPNGSIKIVLVSDNPEKLKEKILPIMTIKNHDGVKRFECSIHTEEDIKKQPSLIKDFHIFYDPKDCLR